MVLGAGSPQQAQVSPASLRGHICILGSPGPASATVVDVVRWATGLGAGALALDLDGRLTALLVDLADKGALGDLDVRVLTPSSPVGIPVTFRPLSALNSSTRTDSWKRLRGWLPQLLATLAGAEPGAPNHESMAGYFLKLLDDTKEENPSMLTVQTLVGAVKAASETPEFPGGAEGAAIVGADLIDLAEDLRNAALAYGAPVDLMMLLETPHEVPGGEGGKAKRHIDVLLLSHLTSVADRNCIITAILLEAFAWCRLRGTEDKLLFVLPEVESPATFLQTRPFSQRLAHKVLASSKGTGMLTIVIPANLDDPPGMPRFGALVIEKAFLDSNAVAMEGVMRDQGMVPDAWQRMSMLSPSEWALAAGTDWSKWHRFTPDPEALRERELDPEALARLLPTEVRDAFRYKPEPEEEGEEAPEAEAAGTRPEAEAARAARVVEEAEDLLSYTTERKPRKTDSRIHQEVQELLKRKLEEKERAKETQKYELQEMDLVEGEVPEEGEAPAPKPKPRPLAEGVIDDHRGRTGEPSAPVELHADDLQLELAVLEAKEADQARLRSEGEAPDVVVDLDQPTEGWETVSPEVALGAEAEERPKRSGEASEEEDEEEIIVELDED